MNVNNANNAYFGTGVVWNENTRVDKEKITDITSLSSPVNADKFVLHPIVSDVTYKRSEFIKGEGNAADTGTVMTYTVRCMTFSDGTSFYGTSENSSFHLNLSKVPRDFAESGVDMNELQSGVEETWLYKQYSYDYTEVSGGISAAFAGEDGAAFEGIDFSASHAGVKYAAASYTKGYAVYKNGSALEYEQSEVEAANITVDSVQCKVESFGAASLRDLNNAAVGGTSAVNSQLSTVNCSNKGLTDRDIFVIFTGREPKKASSSPLGGMDMSGTEDMFDENGNFIYKNDEDFMKHFKKFYELTVFSGVPFDKQDSSAVANFFGNVGKRLDEAYKSGKCTEEQKEALEKMLYDTAAEFSEKAQKRQALLKVCREEFNLPINERKALIEARKQMSPDERKAERKAKINEYVEKFFKIDRETLFNMINAVRFSNINVLSLLPKA